MKFIKRFENYIDKIGDGGTLSEESPSPVEDILKEFNSKKSTLEGIFKSVKDPNKIKSDILSKVYSGNSKSQNKLLKKLENILWSEKSLSEIEEKKDIRTKEKTLLNNKLNGLQKIKTDVFKKEVSDSILTIQNKIKEIEDKIKEDSDKLSDIQKKISEEKLEFQEIEKDFHQNTKSEKN